MRNHIVKLAAVALFAAAGCAAPTADDAAAANAGNAGNAAGEHLASSEQAETAGGFTFGAGAGDVLKIITMIDSVKTYGTPEITSGDLLDQLDATEAKIKSLQTAMGELQNTLEDAQGDALNVPALGKVNVVTNLFAQYRAIAATKNQTNLDAFFAKLPTNGGGLRWSDLGELHDLLVGTVPTGSLLSLTAQARARAGIAGASSDSLGAYFVHMRLVQEEAFFMLAAAAKNDASIDINVQKAEHRERLRAQSLSFRNATNEYFDILVGQANARPIGECECSPDQSVAVCTGLIPGVTPSYSYVDGTSRNEFTSKSACQEKRDSSIAATNGDLRRQLYADFFATQKTFTTLWPATLAAASDASSIKVSSAMYSERTTGTYNDVLGQIANSCNGRQECTFAIDDAQLGQPNPDTSVERILSGNYRCDDGVFTDPGAKSFRVSVTSAGASVTLSCPVIAGSVADLVGHYEDPTPTADGSSNPWAHVSVTKVTSGVVMWTNEAGVSWTLSLTADRAKLDVSEQTSYYQNYGYKQADVKRDASATVTAIVGPFGIVYNRVR